VARGRGLRRQLCLQDPIVKVEVVVDDMFIEFTRLLDVVVGHP
jgi:hypothetical protein